MTTTEDLRKFLDAHGVDGAPTEPGWYYCDRGYHPSTFIEVRANGVIIAGTGRVIRPSSVTRHVPLNLAPPASFVQEDCCDDPPPTEEERAEYAAWFAGIFGESLAGDVVVEPQDGGTLYLVRTPSGDVARELLGEVLASACVVTPDGRRIPLAAGRDLDAEVQAAREVAVRVVPGPQFDDMVRKMASDDLRGLAGKVET